MRWSRDVSKTPPGVITSGPVNLTGSSGDSMSAQLEKWHFNVEQYYRLAEVGVLKPDDRVELIEGEIVKMSPIGSPHAACVTRTNRLFQKDRKSTRLNSSHSQISYA